MDYDIEAFATSDSPFSVSIDDNRFCLDGMHLNIKSDELKVSGRMRYSKTTPIETSPLQPNIMGFFSYIPNMECNHGVISMGHDLIGSLKVNGEVIDFTGGKGYMEKDWGGRSFPSQYLWIQSNHFDQEDVSLFCSVATIPFGLFSFKGFICNLIHEGKEYRFATYNGSKLKVETFTDTNVHIELSNRNYSLIIEGHMVFADKLLAPKMGGAMNKTIKEGLSGEIKIVLKDKLGKIICEDSSQRCGMELVRAL